MDCPCGAGKLDPRDFSAWLSGNQEARMRARAVFKGEKLGGEVRVAMIDGRPGLIVGGDLPSEREQEAAGVVRRFLSGVRARWGSR